MSVHDFDGAREVNAAAPLPVLILSAGRVADAARGFES